MDGTMNAAQAAGGAAPEPETDGAADAQETPGGYCIEIHVDAQNKIKGVSVEQEADESDEGYEEPDNLQPASDIKEALTICLDVFKSHGKASPGDALGKRLQTAGFASGYDEG